MLRQLGKIGLLLALQVLIFLLTGELVLRSLPARLVGNVGPMRMNIRFCDFGPWFTPHQRTRYSGDCFDAYPVTTNFFGMRDKERTLEKPKGLIRISVLGDSYPAALQVRDGRYFSVVAEDLLRVKGLPVEVLNFAFSGYGTGGELLLYRRMVRRFDSDVIVVVFSPGNDIRNNSMKLDYLAYGSKLEDYGSSSVEPYGYFSRTGETLDERPNRRFDSPLKDFLKQNVLHRSYFLDFTYSKLLYLRRARAAHAFEEQNREQANLEPQSGAPGVSNSESTDWEEAWKVTELLLGAFEREVRADGGKFCLVVLPDLVSSVNGGGLQASKRHNRIIALASRLKLDNLDLSPIWLEMIGNNEFVPADLVLPCDGHWNERGNRVAAEACARWLEPQLIAWCARLAQARVPGRERLQEAAPSPSSASQRGARNLAAGMGRAK
jgi:hypothetical protein